MVRESHSNTEEAYMLLGKHLYSKNAVKLGGDITVDEELTINGTGGEDGNVHKLKGIVTDLEEMITIMMVEWPVKNDATNVLYYLEILPNQKKLKFNGKYSGFLHKNVKMTVLDNEDIEGQLGDALMGVEYDDDKRIPIVLELELYIKEKPKVA